MTQIDNIYELISKSKLTTIGYDSISEEVKDQLISRISNNIYDIEYIEQISGIIRDFKIDEILSQTPPKTNLNTIVINIQNLLRSKDIINIIDRRRIYEDIKNSILNTKNNVILTSKVYKTAPNSNSGKQIMGGNYVVYVSDLVLMIENRDIKIIKNRFI